MEESEERERKKRRENKKQGRAEKTLPHMSYPVVRSSWSSPVRTAAGSAWFLRSDSSFALALIEAIVSGSACWPNIWASIATRPFGALTSGTAELPLYKTQKGSLLLHYFSLLCW